MTQVAFEKSYRALRLVFILLVLLTALCAGLHTVGDNDMGWHLATGRWVVEHRQVPRTDVLSFTSAGVPWIYPPFAGVLLYLTYAVFGYAGLSWFCALACLAVVAYLVRRGDMSSAVLAMLAVVAIAARTAPRADLFTTVFFALFLGELWAYHGGSHSRPWLLPVVMLFWVNLHPGFIAGLGAIVAYLLIELADLLFAERRQAAVLRLRRVWPWLAACVAATLVNPWGARIYIASLNLAGLAGSAQGKLSGTLVIPEFMAVPISTHLLYELIDVRHIQFGLDWLLVLSVILAALFFWKRHVGAGLVVLVAFYAALAHARYSALFAITIVTLGSTTLDLLFASPSVTGEALPPRLFRVPTPVVVLLTTAACAIAVLQIGDFISNRTYVVFSPDVRFGTGQAYRLPARASAFISREQLPGNVFEDYELGGYVAWSLGPKYPDFIDGRGINPDLVLTQLALYGEDPDSQAWQKEADRWHLNVLLVSTPRVLGWSKLDPYKFCRSSAWRPIYMDDVSLVFLRNTPNNSSWINRLQIDCFTQRLPIPDSASRSSLRDFYLSSAELFFALHRDRDSEQSLVHVDALDRSDPNLHLLKGLLLERREQYAQAETEFRASLAIVDNSGVLYYLSRVCAKQGHSVEAVQALESAAALAMQPFDIYMTMGRIQIALNHPEQALVVFAKAEKSSPYRGAESQAPEIYAEIAEGRSQAYQLLSRWNEAIAFQRDSTEITPDVPQRWNRLAQLYEATEQTKLAAEAREHMLQLQDHAAGIESPASPTK